MFRELLYVGIALTLFFGVLVLFQSFGSPNGALTGLAVRDGQQTTTPLTGNAVAQQQDVIEQREQNRTAEQTAGASAQFQVSARIVG